MDSNHRRYKPADLQSAPFGHSGIRPCALFSFDGLCAIGASCRIRTNDPEITNHVLWPTELKRRFQFSPQRETMPFPVCGCKVKHCGDDVDFYDPNAENLIALTSCAAPAVYDSIDSEPVALGLENATEAKTVVLVDCGIKHNIIRCLLRRGVRAWYAYHGTTTSAP